MTEPTERDLEMAREWNDAHIRGRCEDEACLDCRGQDDALAALLAKARAPWRECVEALCYQFAYWNPTTGGFRTAGLSTLEEAFDLLGWRDPHESHDARCDETGCMGQATCGIPTTAGYRRVCGEHFAALRGQA